MKFFSEKIFSSLPYLVLFILGGSVLVFFYKYNLSTQEYLDIIRITIWPILVLLSVLFFKKVFTYFFFSMEEFNFFGNKGRLRDITEIIDDRVELRVKEKNEEAARKTESDKLTTELNDARKSKDDSTKKAEENFTLASEFLKKYKILSGKYEQTIKELNLLRYRQLVRDRIRSSLIEQRQNHGGEDNSEKKNFIPKANKINTDLSAPKQKAEIEY